MSAEDSSLQLTPLDEVIGAYAEGRMVIIVDDADRENEGDLAVAAEKVDAQALAFMMQHARGLICVSISSQRARELELPLQVLNNNSPFNTPFTISVDHASVVSEGVTATARAQTIRKLLDASEGPTDFVSPGHVFPLVANPAGVIGRQGQTEGSYDLARLAGVAPAGVICEILSPDGSMLRGTALNDFAKTHNLPMTSVAEILRHRLSQDVLVRSVAESIRQTDHGEFVVRVYQDDVDGKEHLALTYGDLKSRTPLVRMHSECLTGDVFGSRRCDCGTQLDTAMQRIVEYGCGIVLYLRQEGRGIGLANKLKAYALQDQGDDTVEANIKLGFQPDERDFRVAAMMLQDLGVRSVRLLTNNPQKIATLQELGVTVDERVPLVCEVDEYAKAYLDTKREKLGHLL